MGRLSALYLLRCCVVGGVQSELDLSATDDAMLVGGANAGANFNGATLAALTVSTSGSAVHDATSVAMIKFSLGTSVAPTQARRIQQQWAVSSRLHAAACSPGARSSRHTTPAEAVTGAAASHSPPAKRLLKARSTCCSAPQQGTLVGGDCSCSCAARAALHSTRGSAAVRRSDALVIGSLGPAFHGGGRR